MGQGMRELRFLDLGLPRSAWLSGRDLTSLCVRPCISKARWSHTVTWRHDHVCVDAWHQSSAECSRQDAICARYRGHNLPVATTVKVPEGRDVEETGHFQPARACELGKQEFLVSLSLQAERTQRW